MTTADLTSLLSPSQVARQLGVSTELVRQRMNDGRLPAIQTANGRLIDRRDVEEFAKQREDRRKQRTIEE